MDRLDSLNVISHEEPFKGNEKKETVRVREGDVVMEAEPKQGRFECAALMTLKTEEGARSQGLQAASRS